MYWIKGNITYSGPSMGRTWMESHGWVSSNEPISTPIINEYKEWYEKNPDLAPRVREYYNSLMSLNLSASAKTDDIATAINTLDISNEEKITRILYMQTSFQNIVLNLEYLGVDRPQYRAWADMGSLIQNLPTE